MDDLDSRYLTFLIGDAVYGIALTNVLEIINIQSITQVPNIPPHIKGIINLRGKVIPVLDARLKMYKEERPYDDKTCIIVITIHDMHIGLIVDSVSEVITSDRNHLATPPKTGMDDAQFLASIIEQDNKVILNINIEKFFQNDLFGL
ncbi:MAG: purine-binding chemotaxis protein CheW [Clostridiales bacterium]|nr:purine-binding chemotaxis protein CheW [Clostridiales bacterium]